MSTHVCPQCSFSFEDAGRARMGQGTQLAKKVKRLNRNKARLLQALLSSAMPLTVRGVQGIIVNTMRVARESKTGAGWNYHTVQADLSVLVGMGLVQMRKWGDSVFSRTEGTFEVERCPVYNVVPEERMRAEALISDALGTQETIR